jgi:hypothetical protein
MALSNGGMIWITAVRASCLAVGNSARRYRVLIAGKRNRRLNTQAGRCAENAAALAAPESFAAVSFRYA